MKLERLTKTILICAIVVGGVIMLSACSKKSSETTKPVPTDTTTATAAAAVTTAAAEPTPSIPAISGPLESNAVTPTWVETAIDPAAIMYVNVEDFLNIRTGPGTDFEQIGSLTDGMSVTVVAKTDTNWYKLQDGYYVSGDYLTETP